MTIIVSNVLVASAVMAVMSAFEQMLTVVLFSLLGFNVSGVPDLIRDGETGRLAKTSDAEDLGTKLCEMATDHDTTARQGRRSQEIARSEYVSSREANDYQKLYKTILTDHAAAASLPTAISHGADQRNSDPPK